MAEDGTVAASKDRGEIAAFAPKRPMANGIHAAVKRMELQRRDPPVDPAVGQAAATQLLALGDAELPGRERRDRTFDHAGFTLTTAAVANVNLAGHPRQRARCRVTAG